MALTDTGRTNYDIIVRHIIIFLDSSTAPCELCVPVTVLRDPEHGSGTVITTGYDVLCELARHTIVTTALGVVRVVLTGRCDGYDAQSSRRPGTTGLRNRPS